jgi:hypothetical protein
VSANGDNIIFLPDEIMLADDGNVTIDIAWASVQMARTGQSGVSDNHHDPAPAQLGACVAERYCN